MTVHAPVADVDVECDAIFATDEEGVCYVTVWQGTDLNLTVQVTTFSDEIFSIAGESGAVYG